MLLLRSIAALARWQVFPGLWRSQCQWIYAGK